MNNNVKTLDPPSEEFEDSLSWGGTPVANCDLCGRVNFAGNDSFYEEGELERLRQKAKEAPERYYEHPDCDGVSLATIDNQQAVIGCPCNNLRRYENFIWNNRSVILKYLSKRNRSERIQAETELERIAAILDETE